MILYWVRNITSNRPAVHKYISHQTDVNNAAREIFNGRHTKYFRSQTAKHNPKADVLLYSEEDISLISFHHDELQEESED